MNEFKPGEKTPVFVDAFVEDQKALTKKAIEDTIERLVKENEIKIKERIEGLAKKFLDEKKKAPDVVELWTMYRQEKKGKENSTT